SDVRVRDGVDLALRVGLNSGRVIAGEVSSKSLGYTTIGLTKAQREPVIQPHTVGDDLRRVPVSLVRRRCSGHDHRSWQRPGNSPTWTRPLTNLTVPFRRPLQLVVSFEVPRSPRHATPVPLSRRLGSAPADRNPCDDSGFAHLAPY